jgi:hypothetical protein
MRAVLIGVAIVLVLALGFGFYPVYKWTQSGGTRLQEDIKIFMTELGAQIFIGSQQPKQWGGQGVARSSYH